MIYIIVIGKHLATKFRLKKIECIILLIWLVKTLLKNLIKKIEYVILLIWDSMLSL